MTTIQRTVTLHKRPDQQIFGLRLGNDISHGIYIITIEPNSPAADAYIQPGDRILAVNGQLISQILGNPREIVSELASRVQSLTLTLESSDILRIIDEPFTNGYYNNYYQYSSDYNQGIDYDLESYIKGLFLNENLKISPVSSWNNDQYMLMPDQYSVCSRHRHHHRKRKHYKTQGTQTSTDELKENIQPLASHQVVPSIDTYHVLLNNSQLSTQNNEIDKPPEHMSMSNIPAIISNQDFHQKKIVNYPQVNIDEKQHTILEPNKTSLPINKEGLREVNLYRSSNFQGFGFEVEFNKVYYICHHIETNSPAQQGGLRENDVLRKINNQPIDKMPYATFLQMMKDSNKVTLIVQSLDDYKRTHLEALPIHTTKSTSNAINNNNKIDRAEHKNVFSNFFRKLTKR
ncbi:unnamed protein product [Rotaria sp. Silwood1]|nr:unnamed protein product [Rotaria sp. Silwood1]CAF5038712.1 unnamed protein product [Rotaria sp. Silwood1]